VTGGIAPFSVETYAETASRATLIKLYAQGRQMPPWNAAVDQGFPEGQGFVQDRSLTQEQIDLLAAWADAGAPEGDPDEPLPPINVNTDWTFGEPDLIVEMPEPWTMQPTDPDIYRCFVFAANYPVDVTISSMDFKPSNLLIAHHALVFLDPNREGVTKDAASGTPTDGWTCFGSPGVSGQVLIGGWAPGGGTQAYSERTGYTIPAGADLIVQMHYHAYETEQSDQTQIGLKIASDPNILKLYQAVPTRTNFTIPAQTFNFQVSHAVNVNSAIHLIASFPHMHMFGRELTATADLPDPEPDIPIIYVDNWDFDWQNFYVYKQPIALPAGSVINFVGIYDNPTDNPVSGGPGSLDEMLTLGIAWTYDSQGVPDPPDSTGPQIVTYGAVGDLSSVFVEFDETIKVPGFPWDVDFVFADGSVRLAPASIQVQDETLSLGFNPALTAGDYRLQVNAFFAVSDPAGNFLDGNGNGVGGELSDDRAFLYALTPTPVPADVWVDFPYDGTETGWFERPFNTLAEGVGAVAAGGTVRIKPGTTNETGLFTKPVRLESAGGIVRIGEQ